MFTLTAGIALLAVAFNLFGRQAARGEDSADTQAAKTEATKMVRVKVIGPDGQLTGPVEMAKLVLSDEEWQKRLTPEQFAIVRAKGTERAFCGTLLDNKKHGYYVCVACGLPLFNSTAKFNSGTGWPSFFQPVAEENILEETDLSHGMKRTEIMCARCDGHLGHVFPDGPKPTGLRYCLNSESLRFVDEADVKTLAENVPAAAAAPTVGKWLPAPAKDTAPAAESTEAKAVFAGGCFWCTEAVFEAIDGVKDVVSGYSGGDPKRADYKSVCTGTTGHAEGIQITYDASKVTYGQLLRIFFATHNPTTINRQGPDSGTQYRSAIFYTNDEQKAVAEAYIQQLTDAKKFSKPIVTEVEPLNGFFPAEDYHQDFARQNPEHPYIKKWAEPKLGKLQEMLKDTAAERQAQ